MYYNLIHEDYIGEDVYVVGKPLHRDVDLSYHESSIGTNYNDVLRSTSHIYRNDGVNEWVEELVYEAPRDLRIVVWESEYELNLKYGIYRIVSLKDFDVIKNDIYIENKEEEYVRTYREYDELNRLPHYFMKTNYFKNSGIDIMRANESTESAIDEYGVRISYRKLRDRHTDYKWSRNTRPRKSWKVEKKRYQWM